MDLDLEFGFGREADAPPTKILDFRGIPLLGWTSTLMGPSNCGLDLHIGEKNYMQLGYIGSAQRALDWTSYYDIFFVSLN